MFFVALCKTSLDSCNTIRMNKIYIYLSCPGLVTNLTELSLSRVTDPNVPSLRLKENCLYMLF